VRGRQRRLRHGGLGRELGALGKIRMLGDGNGDFARALGLERDLTRSSWECGRGASRCSSTRAS